MSTRAWHHPEGGKNQKEHEYGEDYEVEWEEWKKE